MSASRDYPGTMRTHPPLDDRTVEDLLAGRVPRERTELDDVARVLTDLRSAAHGPCPRPNSALASILTDGLPADLATTPTRAAAATRRWRPRLAYLPGSPATIGALVAALGAKLAGLGVIGKTAVALTAAAAVAAGAAATDLPHSIGDALRGGAEHAPADRPHDSELGEVLPDGATGPSERPDAAEERERADAHPEREQDPSVDEAGDAPPPGPPERARQETADTPASPRAADRPQPRGPSAAPTTPPREAPRGPRPPPAREEPPAPPAPAPTVPAVPDPAPVDAPQVREPRPAPSTPRVSEPPVQAPVAPQIAPTAPSPGRP